MGKCVFVHARERSLEFVSICAVLHLCVCVLFSQRYNWGPQALKLRYDESLEAWRREAKHGYFLCLLRLWDTRTISADTRAHIQTIKNRRYLTSSLNLRVPTYKKIPPRGSTSEVAPKWPRRLMTHTLTHKTQTHTHINLNHQPPPLALPLFPECVRPQRALVSCPKAFGSSRLDETVVGVFLLLCYHQHMCVSLCVHVLWGHVQAAGWSPQSQKERAEELEWKRERVEKRSKEWERPPLAVPPGWFELGSPAGIQACTSCLGFQFVCVRKVWEGWIEHERRRPVARRQLPIRL